MFSAVPSSTFRVILEFQGSMSQKKMLNNENRDDGKVIDPKPNKRIYQRYTPTQIQGLQEEFDRNPHPTDNERKALGQALRIDAVRVRFWFQNRRSQAKKRYNKDLNMQLMEENNMLRAANASYRTTLQASLCQTCKGLAPSEVVKFLRAENENIKQEITRITTLMENHNMKGTMSCPFDSGESYTESFDLGFEGFGAQCQ